jgi:hypothetical protein
MVLGIAYAPIAAMMVVIVMIATAMAFWSAALVMDLAIITGRSRMKVSLREYLRNTRHAIRIWWYSLSCEHNWLFEVGGPIDAMTPYWHCTKCGKVTGKRPGPTVITEFPMAKPGATISTQKLNALEGDELKAYLDEKFKEIEA